jgi:uncharacterized membrane protein YjjB (DUF3815 family)
MRKITPMPECYHVMAFVAFMMSYAVNKSILWAIVHSFCSGWYVAYWLFSYTEISEWINQWVVY